MTFTEAAQRLLAQATELLGPRPDIQSEQFIQHDVATCFEAKRLALAVVRAHCPESVLPVLARTDAEIMPSSSVGRYLLDGPSNALCAFWSRLLCIDFVTGREYEQPYFVYYPDAARTLLEDRRAAPDLPAGAVKRRLTLKSAN